MNGASPIAERLRNAAAPSHSRKAWLAGEQRTMTYGELGERVRRFAGVLAAQDVGPGDRVVLSSADDVETAWLIVALIACGVTAVPLDPETPVLRAQALIAKTGPRLVIADRALAQRWGLDDGTLIEIAPRPAKSGLFGPRPVAQGLEARLEAAVPTAPPTEVPAETIAYVLFTSGTTSRPKGVMISHRALFAHVKTLSQAHGCDSDSRILNPLSLFHADGLTQGPLLALEAGATLHRPGRFEVGSVERLLDAVYQRRITHMVAAPTMLSLMLRLGGAQRDAFQGGDFRLMVSCAAALEPRLWEETERAFGIEIVNVYGLTETVTGGLFKRGAKDGKFGAIGRPIDCEVRVADAEGAEVAAGQPGELQMRGPLLMSGYLDDPQATAEVLSGGWFSTGDVARCDADGDYWILGRRKAEVIRGGLNIHPEEVAEALNALAGVRESVVFGEPDAEWGETLTALVAAEPGITEAALLAHCRERLEPYKIPSRILMTDALPKGISGKVMLAAARDLAREIAARGAASPGVTATGGDVESRFMRVAAQALKTEPGRLSHASSPEDVMGWDSLAHLELVTAIEGEFGVIFTPRQIMAMDNLGKALAYVRAA